MLFRNQKKMMQVIEAIKEKYPWALNNEVGSRVTCNPIPENGDYDILVCIDSNILDSIDSKRCITREYLYTDILNGWEYNGSSIISISKNRFGNYVFFESFSIIEEDGSKSNLIITFNRHFYDNFILATNIAKDFNLLIKGDRIKLFQGILYREYFKGEL